jgi:hypothetical protein
VVPTGRVAQGVQRGFLFCAARATVLLRTAGHGNLPPSSLGSIYARLTRC